MVFAGSVLALFGIIHVALVFHGQSTVSAAAQDGLYATQLEGGTAANGRAAAELTLSLNPGLRNEAIDISVSTSNGRCEQVVVRVRATVATPVVDLLNDVDAQVIGPCERFFAETERR